MPLPLGTDDVNLLAARARAYAELFTLPLKDRNWRGSSGDYAGAGVGSSLDFQDHRSYVPGDDPRHINWQAYARTGQYSLKLYREEVRPLVEIIFDVSDSMFADAGKAARTIELFYFAVASSERSGASTSVFLIKGDHWQAIESRTVFSHRWQDSAAKLPVTSASAEPNLSALPLRARSLRVFISDLLFPISPEMTIRSLTRNFGKAVTLCPYSKSEDNPGWTGNYEFIDTENGEKHRRRVDPEVLRRYIIAYKNHFARWKASSIRAQAPLARIPSEPGFEASLKQEAIPSGAINLA